MVAVLFHALMAVETAAQQGRQVVLMMLGVGGVFIFVIAFGELTHWLRHKRR